MYTPCAIGGQSPTADKLRRMRLDVCDAYKGNKDEVFNSSLEER